MQSDDVQEETFEELQVMLEELRVADEDLAVVHQVAEAERQRYQELFDFAPDGYLVTDAVGTIREANRAAAAMLAVPQPRLRGKPLVVFVPQAERRAFRPRLIQLQQRRCIQEWEVHLQPRQGEPFHAVITVVGGYDRQGKVVAVRWLLCDISVRQSPVYVYRGATGAAGRRTAAVVQPGAVPPRRRGFACSRLASRTG